MLRKLIIITIAGGFFLPLLGATWAARSIVVAAAPAQEEEHADETELETAMLAIQDDLKALRRSVKDPEKRAESLATINRLQIASVQCKGLEPLAAADLMGDAKEEFLSAYRREMIIFLRGLLDLEAEVLNGNVDGAQEILKLVRGMEDPSHEQFMKDF